MLATCCAWSALAGRAEAQSTPKNVTLITGDRVTLSGPNDEAVTIQRAAGRDGMSFVTRRVPNARGGSPHLHVIPSDALPLLAAGQIDPRLFDVTLLVDFGYDDAHRSDLPLIVAAPQRSARRTAALAPAVAGASVGWDLSSIDAVSVSSGKARVHELWASVTAGSVAQRSPAATSRASAAPLTKIWLDGLVQPVLDRSAAQVGAPAAWALGTEGDGVVVAVLDTGVDEEHPDLADRVIATQNFTSDADGDDVGHGTHVASIIAGSGAASGGRYRGIAPGAQLVSGKVCDPFGCAESSVIAAMQWAITEEGARIVNLSLGGPDTPDVDPLEDAIDTLSAEYGALFVVAAGNVGPDPSTLESPASAERALSVGAVERDDQVAWFSARGPRLGDTAIGIDLTAPGVGIVAARAAGTGLDELVGDDYVALSGTSMAAPHVAGAAALLLEQHPEWDAVELEAALVGSAAFRSGETPYTQGGGRIDIAAALETSLLASVPSLSFGLALWPHDDDPPMSRAVMIENLGAATELVVELDLTGPDGLPPPSGMFEVTPPSFSLPEDGSATLSVGVDTRVAAPDGAYGGRLIASDGAGRQIAIPIAVVREDERYQLSVEFIGGDGARTADVASFVFGYDSPVFTSITPTTGAPSSLRLPPGRYAIEARFFDVDGVEPDTIMLAPRQLLGADTQLVFDAREAEPVSVIAPSANARPIAFVLDYVVRASPDWVLDSGTSLGDTLRSPLYYSKTLAPFAPELGSVLEAHFIDTSSTSPELNASAWSQRERLPVGPIMAIDPRQRAIVHARYAASRPKPDLRHAVGVGAFPEWAVGYFLPNVTVDPPYRRTEYYYSPDTSLRWVNDFSAYDQDFFPQLLFGLVPASYRAGRRYTSRWNEPPFSTVLPHDAALSDWIERSGDTLSVSPPMHGDREVTPASCNTRAGSGYSGTACSSEKSTSARSLASSCPRSAPAIASRSPRSKPGSSSRLACPRRGPLNPPTLPRIASNACPCSACVSIRTSARAGARRAACRSACRSPRRAMTATAPRP